MPRILRVMVAVATTVSVLGCSACPLWDAERRAPEWR